VPTALYCFLSHAESFEDAVAYAVSLGGDTDSIAAMTGAIAGAYHGSRAIPERWRSTLEEGAKGARYVEKLADRLLERHREIQPRRTNPRR
jgi:poly(ADP-ribose) glycohydrolase ARH3